MSSCEIIEGITLRIAATAATSWVDTARPNASDDNTDPPYVGLGLSVRSGISISPRFPGLVRVMATEAPDLSLAATRLQRAAHSTTG